MTFEELQAKVLDVIKDLNAKLIEAQGVETAKAALERSGYVNTEREQKITKREIDAKKQEEDLLAQKKFIEEQTTLNQTLLNKIILEKAEAKKIAEEKRVTEEERAQFEADKAKYATLQAEREKLDKEKEEFAQEKALFAKEKLAMKDSQELLETREVNIKAKEERLDRIERMTTV